MIQVVSITCPNCGSDIDINTDRSFSYCPFCGSKLVVYNTNERIYRKIDEARLKEAELESAVELKKLEMEERQKEHERRIVKIRLFGVIFFLIAGIITGVIVYFTNSLLVLCLTIIFIFIALICIPFSS